MIKKSNNCNLSWWDCFNMQSYIDKSLINATLAQHAKP